jgi:hypothetical protein
VDLRGSRTATPVTVRLEAGRRKHVASVAPAPPYQPPEPADEGMSRSARVLHTLRALADPEVSGYEGGVRGGLQTTGRPVVRRPQSRPEEILPEERTLYNTKVGAFFNASVDVTAQASISADRRYVRLSVVPVFNTITGINTFAAGQIIPGGFGP